MPVNFGSVSQEKADENFNNLKICDTLKDDFCRDNNYKIIRISYLELPNIITILHTELIDIIELD